MTIHPTILRDCYIIEPKVYTDQRGYFYESFNKNTLENLLGRNLDFVQDNHAQSGSGVLRGLHFQEGTFAQAKLVQVARGEVLDVVVDLRADSQTYGRYLKVRLSAENRKILFIPRGMAHGYVSMADDTLFLYKCDNYYHPEAEGGILYNDPDLAINWEYPEDKLVISDKDRNWPLLKQWIQ